MYSFEGQNCNAVWLKCAEALLKEPDEDFIVVDSRNGKTHELPHVLLTISNSVERYAIDRLPPINIAFALAEVVWILQGSANAKVINFWNSKLPKFSGKTVVYAGAYGYRLSHYFGFNQIEAAYNALREDPITRRVVLTIWGSQTDFPRESFPRYSDIPCNICSMLKVRDGKLWWSQIMRSNDIFLGTPYNLIQFTVLQELLASWLNLKVGAYSLYCDSLHLYLKNQKEVKNSVISSNSSTNIPENTDRFELDYEQTATVVKMIYAKMVRAIQNEITTKEHEDFLAGLSHTPTWQNIYRVIMAYAASKHNNLETMNALVAEISNPALYYCWKNWKARRKST
jgi:thymidylate synthase